MLDRRYETFLTLVKTNSYTKTAQQLFITQPAVTQQIASLQNDLQIQLVKYQRPNLIITTAGKQLARFIEGVAIQSDQLIEHLKKPNERRPLRFGATLSFNAIVEPAFIKKIAGRYANIDCLVANTDAILHGIDNGEIEFGLVEGNFKVTDYTAIPIFDDQFIAVCSPQNQLAKKASVTLQDCFTNTLVLRESGSGTRAILTDWLSTGNHSVADFRKAITVGDMATIIRLIEENVGISFMYRSLAMPAIASGKLISLPLENFDISRTLSMVFPHHAYFETQYQKLAKSIQTIVNQ